MDLGDDDGSQGLARRDFLRVGGTCALAVALPAAAAAASMAEAAQPMPVKPPLAFRTIDLQK